MLMLSQDSINKTCFAVSQLRCNINSIQSGVNDNMIPLKEMQNWLGHSDIRTTLRYINSTVKSREQIIAFANHY